MLRGLHVAEFSKPETWPSNYDAAGETGVKEWDASRYK